MREIVIIVLLIAASHVVAFACASLPGSMQKFEESDWQKRIEEMQTQNQR